MLEILTIAVVLAILLGAAALGGFYYLIKHPPVIHVDVGDIDLVTTVDVSNAIPSTLTLRLQHATPIQDTKIDEPLPKDIIDYCNAESDDWARTVRKQHSRTLKLELGDWDLVLAKLKAEDGIEE